MNRNMKWHKRYSDLAAHISTWSKDPSTGVGAVAIDSDTGQILSTGYNGFPRGVGDHHDRLHDRDKKLSLTIHAELNVVHNASLTGISLEGSDLYVSGLPTCSKCALSIIQSGIRRVIVREEDVYKSNVWNAEWYKALDLYKEVGIETLVIKCDK